MFCSPVERNKRPRSVWWAGLGCYETGKMMVAGSDQRIELVDGGGESIVDSVVSIVGSGEGIGESIVVVDSSCESLVGSGEGSGKSIVMVDGSGDSIVTADDGGDLLRGGGAGVLGSGERGGGWIGRTYGR